MSESSIPVPGEGKSILRKALKITAWIAVAIILLTVLAIAGLSIYLTPARLTEIVNREGSRYLDADIRAENVDYTFWSTFPVLYVSADSIVIHSRSLSEVSGDIRRSLPSNSDFLASTGPIKAGINVWKAIHGKYEIKSVEISSPDLNLVSYDRSINNFSIFPSVSGDIDIPHITIDTVKIPAPVRISYYDAGTGSSASADIKNFILHQGQQPDSYGMSVSACGRMESGRFHTDEDIPVEIKGDVRLKFNPLNVELSDFSLNLAGVDVTTDLDMTADRRPVLNTFSASIASADINEAASYFNELIPDKIKMIKGRIPLYLDIDLTEPYTIPDDFKTKGIPDIPAFTIHAKVNGGDLSYPISGRERLSLSDLDMSVFLDIDPRNERANTIEMRNCSFSTDDGKINITGDAREILSGNPLINADMQCNADLGKIIRILQKNPSLRIDGILKGNTSLSCRLSDLSDPKVENIDADASFTSPSIRIIDSSKKLMAYLSGVSFNLDAILPVLSGKGLADGNFNFSARADKIRVNNSADTSAIVLDSACLTTNLGAAGSAPSPTAAGALRFSAKGLSASMPSAGIEASGLSADMKASLRHTPWSSSTAWSPGATSEGDSILSGRVVHSPLYLSLSIPPMLQTALSLSDADADIKIEGGKLLSDGYPADNCFSNLHITTDLDSLEIKSIHLKSRSTEADLSAEIKDLRGFLLSPSPSLLRVRLDADFNDVNINELAGTYYAGVSRLTGKAVDFTVPPIGPYTAADSLCIAIPRNLHASLNLKSDKAEYMGWTFSPLSTSITMHDGVARIGGLKIGSDFCKADVDWTYSTENLDDIFMHLRVGVNDFDFDRFFTAFPSLLEQNPQLANLSGSISAEAEGEFNMFPSMFLNTPSMTGEATINVDSIQYARDKKMERITHFMLIKGDEPLKVDNFTIHSSFHDNLLQLDPFTIRCGGYEIMGGGVNNLQGEIYYHLGLIRSPFHFPFGVNIVGNYHHPEIRFGGKGIKDGRERRISSSLHDTADVNIMTQLKHGWLLFIENAAKYDFSDNHGYVFNVPNE